MRDLGSSRLGALLLLVAAVEGCGPRAATPAASVPLSATGTGGPRPGGHGPTPSAVAAAAEIDDLLEQQWRAAAVVPAAPASDDEYLRRVTLDLLRRIPTLAEIDAHQSLGRGTGRAELVDTLLASAEHAEAWADLYLELFVGGEFRKPGVTKRLDPRGYFVEAIRANRRFDQVATELLTFTGPIEPSGPGVFLASHLKGGGAEEAAAATARLFLGLQLQCAQCHDHPYDARYRQEDFYGLAAYFARTKSRARRATGPDGEDMATASEDMAAPPDRDRPGRVYAIVDKTRGQTTFRRPDSLEDVVAVPRFLGRELQPAAGETPRQTLARAVVQSELFAKVVVDRTWAQLFGTGLVEPWDDLGGENDARHPELLNRLAVDFRNRGFDVRRLLRTLVLSRAYGLTSRTPPSDGAEAVAPGAATFARAAVRRAAPDQIFRSLLVATGAAHTERPGGEPMDKKIARLRKEYLFVFADEERAEVDTFDGNIPQTLLLWNGEIVNRGARALPGGVLAGILAERPQPGARLERMFLATLSRSPSATERARLLPVLTASGAGIAAYEDVFFALLTSTEMLTNH